MRDRTLALGPLEERWSRPGALLEAPAYDPDQGLAFSDARGGGVRRLSQTGEVTDLLPHRRGIGGMVEHEHGGFVVTGRNVAYKRPGDSAGQVLLDRDESLGRVGFNDLTTDRLGRVYVGAVGVVALEADLSDPTLRPGGIEIIELDGSSRRVADDVRVPNGMAFSEDGTILYASDSGRRVVLRFDVDPLTGDLSGRSTFLECSEGVPDGMAMSADGSLWLALAYAGKILRCAPDGSVIETIHVPEPMVTSLCFAGEDFRTVYVLTGAPHDEPATQARIYSAQAGISGLPVTPARVSLPLPPEPDEEVPQ